MIRLLYTTPVSGWRTAAFMGLSLALASCSGMKPADFASQSPKLEIEKYFAGHTRSTGLIEARGGKPLKAVNTETWGRLEGGELRMTQELKIGDQPPTSRKWVIKRLDEHHYEATTDNMIGKAKGEAGGNVLRLSYVLALQPGNPLSNVRMTHWMQLQPDGRTLLNSVTVKKTGIVVARISEVFHKESDTTRDRGPKR